MSSSDAALRPAAFLDRDGTVVAEKEYMSDPDQVELLPGAAEALRLLADAGYALVMATNQSGIARGYYGEAEYRDVQNRLERMLEELDIRIDGAFHCPHHPDFTGPCDCRKPAPGLFLTAAAELDLDLAASVYIGDRLRDVVAGADLGGRAILVRTGYGRGEEARAPAGIEVADDVLQAARLAVRGLDMTAG